MAQSPYVDLTFNGNGRSVVNLTQNTDKVTDVVLQSTGKIILTGTANLDNFSFTEGTYFAMTRMNTDGTLDTTFGDNGKVTTDFAGNARNDIALGAAVQPDDKILLTGFIRLTEGDSGFFATIRYNPDGSIDTSFGTNGRVTLSVIPSGINDAYAVTVAPSGEIAVAGRFWNGSSLQTGVVRLSSTGTLLGTMTNSQDVGAGGYNAPNAVRIQPDGKIVTGGYIQLGGQNVYYIKLVRFNTDGSLDSGFGTGGVVSENTGINEIINDIELLPDGSIVACGTQSSFFLLIKFLPNGQLDTSFGTNGRMVTGFDNSYAIASQMVVRPNGKIVLAGRSVNDIAVAYYNANGSPDTTFNGSGKLAFNFPLGSYVIPSAVAIDSRGRVVLGGASSENLTNAAFAATRLKSLDVFPATVSGRAVTMGGQPIRSATVTITDSLGQSLQTTTSSLGYYQFSVMSGQTYTLTASQKRYRFQPAVVPVNGSITDVDIIGQSSQESFTEVKSVPVGTKGAVLRGKN